MTQGRPVFVQGNEAYAEGAPHAGLGFFAGYPITPSSEIAEILSRRLPERSGRYDLRRPDHLPESGSGARVRVLASQGLEHHVQALRPGGILLTDRDEAPITSPIDRRQYPLPLTVAVREAFGTVRSANIAALDIGPALVQEAGDPTARHATSFRA